MSSRIDQTWKDQRNPNGVEVRIIVTSRRPFPATTVARFSILAEAAERYLGVES